MVETVKAASIAGTTRTVARVAATPPTSPVQAGETTPSETTAKLGLSKVAADMAAAAPVDTDRVSRIRKAIAEGTFPIQPTTIADVLLALRMEWKSNEPA